LLGLLRASASPTTPKERSKRGFARARLADGSFTKTDSRKGFKTDFYEANCWEYSFFVPHDMAALVARCGGKDSFRDRLSYAMAMEKSGLARNVTIKGCPE